MKNRYKILSLILFPISLLWMDLDDPNLKLSKRFIHILIIIGLIGILLIPCIIIAHNITKPSASFQVLNHSDSKKLRFEVDWTSNNLHSINVIRIDQIQIPPINILSTPMKSGIIPLPDSASKASSMTIKYFIQYDRWISVNGSEFEKEIKIY
jgi:hypothetical protein